MWLFLNNDNDKLITDDKGVAAILNLMFSNVFTEENNAVILISLNIFHGPDEDKLDTTKSNVHIYNNRFYDEISPRLLKECCAQLQTLLTLLFSKSLT